MSVPAATFVALLTPPGRGAIATLALAGPQALAAVEHCFRSARAGPLADYALDEIAFGHWLATGEEVVVSRRGDQRIEICCHGGSAAVEAILDALAAQGCQPLTAAAWLRLHQPDRFAAEATLALAEARTLRTASILLDQQAGALRRELAAILAGFDAGDLACVTSPLQALQARSPLGRHLTEPFRIAVAGPANVGKSTLVNAILGYQRSIVCDQPGTTRDLVTASTAIDGWPLELVDTAGLRAFEEPLDNLVERLGIERAVEQVKTADLVLLVVDLTAWSAAEEILRSMVASPQADRRQIIVYNKCDQVSELPAGAISGLLVSALTGDGVPALLETIGQCLVPEPPPPGAAVPFMAAHFTALEEAQAWLASGNLARARRVIEALFAGSDSHEARSATR